MTIILNGGYYYLFGSKGTCCSGVNSTYHTVVGRSAGITGPYLDQNGTDLASGGGTTALTGVYPKVAAGGATTATTPGRRPSTSARSPLWRLARHRWPTRSGEQPPAEPQQRQVRGRLVSQHGGRRGRELGEL